MMNEIGKKTPRDNNLKWNSLKRWSRTWAKHVTHPEYQMYIAPQPGDDCWKDPTEKHGSWQQLKPVEYGHLIRLPTVSFHPGWDEWYWLRVRGADPRPMKEQTSLTVSSSLARALALDCPVLSGHLSVFFGEDEVAGQGQLVAPYFLPAPDGKQGRWCSDSVYKNIRCRSDWLYMYCAQKKHALEWDSDRETERDGRRRKGAILSAANSIILANLMSWCELKIHWTKRSSS